MIRKYDLRSEQTNPPNIEPPKHRIVSGRVALRLLKNITGVVLHQTATPYGVTDAAVDLAGGNRELALARRSLRVACHAMAFRDGFFTLPCPLTWYVYHGNGFNATTLGIEIEGKYAGEESKKADGDQELDAVVIESARAALKYLVEEARTLGAPVRFIYAHRQSSETRRADPGEAIWKSVAVEYGSEVLGLERRPELVMGGGRQLPSSWDPLGRVRY